MPHRNMDTLEDHADRQIIRLLERHRERTGTEARSPAPLPSERPIVETIAQAYATGLCDPIRFGPRS